MYSKYLESARHIVGTQIIPEWMIATIFFLNVDQVHPVKSDQDMVKGPEIMSPLEQWEQQQVFEYKKQG